MGDRRHHASKCHRDPVFDPLSSGFPSVFGKFKVGDHSRALRKRLEIE